MKKIILINKKEGETPLEALEKFRKSNQEYKDMPMTYAGRLDPMASGLLLLLAGQETKKKEKYLALPKEYEFSVLFGFATDTFDILGKIREVGNKRPSKEEIKKEIKKFEGKWKQEYPPYSSKIVRGKPLFSYARAGESVEIPKREVHIEKIEFLEMREISQKELLENIGKRIRKVKGDFRQEEILDIWQEKLSDKQDEPKSYSIVDFRIKCGSGTYVRAIANELGDKIGIPTLAFSIRRTRIGKWCKI